jgi:XrtJ-associated TM-motif-TM protein
MRTDKQVGLQQEFDSAREGISMKRWAWMFFGIALFILVAAPLHAQDGCIDSPENPTAVLALVGCAGAAFSVIWARMKARRR